MRIRWKVGEKDNKNLVMRCEVFVCCAKYHMVPVKTYAIVGVLAGRLGMHVGRRIGARGAHLLEVYCLSIKKLIVKNVLVLFYLLEIITGDK